MKKDISLYIHIPFCAKKCNYCDFLSFPDCERAKIKEYVEVLCHEVGLYPEISKEHRVVSIFVGGGTPSLLELEEMEAIFHAIHQAWEVASFAEITIEVNPGTVDKKKLLGYRQLGINRLSIGLQSSHKDELECLGRIHTYEQFVATYYSAREAGFDNINVDLMSGLPDQTMASYRKTLSRVLKLRPEHISAYSLIIEEGTPFYNDEAVLGALPDEEVERNMYAYTKTMLAGYGYQRYEVSNYSLKDKECKHNIVYWTGGAYLGMGLGAASYLMGVRFHNTSDMNQYMKLLNEQDTNSIVEDIEEIHKKAQMEEYMFLGLRMMQGVSITEFWERFGDTMQDVYGEVLEEHISKGLLIQKEDRICLTEQGISLSNYVLADFLLPDEKFL